eukprot:955435_1
MSYLNNEPSDVEIDPYEYTIINPTLNPHRFDHVHVDEMDQDPYHVSCVDEDCCVPFNDEIIADIIPPPIRDYFMNHPHFNTPNNKTFDYAMSQFIDSTSFGLKPDAECNRIRDLDCCGICTDDCMLCDEADQAVQSQPPRRVQPVSLVPFNSIKIHIINPNDITVEARSDWSQYSDAI